MNRRQFLGMVAALPAAFKAAIEPLRSYRDVLLDYGPIAIQRDYIPVHSLDHEFDDFEPVFCPDPNKIGGWVRVDGLECYSYDLDLDEFLSRFDCEFHGEIREG